MHLLLEKRSRRRGALLSLGNRAARRRRRPARLPARRGRPHPGGILSVLLDRLTKTVGPLHGRAGGGGALVGVGASLRRGHVSHRANPRRGAEPGGGAPDATGGSSCLVARGAEDVAGEEAVVQGELIVERQEFLLELADGADHVALGLGEVDVKLRLQLRGEEAGKGRSEGDRSAIAREGGGRWRVTNVSGSGPTRMERGEEGSASRRGGETGRSRSARGGTRKCFGGHPHLLAKSGNTGHVLNVVQDAGAERGLSERVHGGEDRGIGAHGDLLEPGGLLGGVRLAQVAALAVSGGLTGSAALVGGRAGSGRSAENLGGGTAGRRAVGWSSREK